MIAVWISLLIGAFLFLVLLVLYRIGYMQSLPEWTGLRGYEKVQFTEEETETGQMKHVISHEQQGKTLWDWLQLFIVPIVLAIIAFSFNAGQESMNETLEQQRQQEQLVDNYLDRMSTLLLEYHLHDSKPNDPVRATAQAITLTALDRLDASHKGTVILFLYRADIIRYHFEFEDNLPPQQRHKVQDKVQPIITLPYADLEGIELDGVYLGSVDLHNEHLREANFHASWLERANLGDSYADHADFSNADMRAANIYHTNLVDANFQGAMLQYANMIGIFLSGARLDGAYLQYANLGVYLQPAQLDHTTLVHANLTGANLTQANLTGANLTRANLTGAKVTSKQLAMAKSLAGAIMPDGSIHS